jgi:hypothetical protein
LNDLNCLAQREMSTSRKEHDSGTANQPEKEEQKEGKDNT